MRVQVKGDECAIAVLGFVAAHGDLLKRFSLPIVCSTLARVL